MYYDLGVEKDVSDFIIWGENYYSGIGTVKKVTFHYLPSGSVVNNFNVPNLSGKPWQLALGNQSVATNTGKGQTFALPNKITTRYIKVTIKDATWGSAGDAYGFNEFAVCADMGTTPPPTTCQTTCPQGTIEAFEYKTGSSGNDVTSVYNHSSFPNTPFNVHTLNKLEMSSVAAKNGVYVRGFLYPPTTGNYDIYLASDDQGKLWVSSDCDPANKALVGQVSPTCGWTNFKQWNKCASQKTSNVYLEAGKAYYFEMIMKNGGGPGHWAIGWKKPGGSGIHVVQNNEFANYKCTNCTNPTNLALNKPTYQSSTGWGGYSSRAVDGNTNGNFYNGSVTHTLYQYRPYWELDLQSINYIDKIKIWNRTDCCKGRLKEYYVLVSNVPFGTSNLSTLLSDPNVWSNYQSVAAATPTTITVGRTGRYVCVMLKNTNYLTIAEVKVMGCSLNSVTSKVQIGSPILSTMSDQPFETAEIEVESTDAPEITKAFEVAAYPNPFNHIITVEGYVPTTENGVTLRLLNTNGIVVHREHQIGSTGYFTAKLDLPNLPSGLYILEATTDTDRKSIKLVKIGTD